MAPRPGPSEFGIEEPFDAAREPERAELAAVQGGVGHDPRAVEGEKRQGLVVVDVVGPAFDEPAALDAIPREAAPLSGKFEEEGVQRVDVLGAKRADRHATFVVEYRACGVTISHHVTRNHITR